MVGSIVFNKNVNGSYSRAVSSFSITEDMVGLDRGNAPGGYSRLQVSGDAAPILGVKDRNVTLVSSRENSASSFKIANTSINVSGWSLEANSPLCLLNVESDFRPDPVITSPVDAVKRLFRGVGAMPNNSDIVTDYGFTVRQIDGYYESSFLPSVEGNVWSHLKKWLSANGLNISTAGREFVIRRVGDRDVNLRSFVTDFTISENEHEEAQTILCNVYVRKKTASNSPIGGTRDHQIVYPVPPSKYPRVEHPMKPTGDPQVISVGAGETVEVEFALSAELESIRQPHMSYGISEGYLDGWYVDSVFAVSGKDNRLIIPQMWEDYGGSLKAELLPGGRSVKVTIIGPNLPHLEPFRIAESDGNTDRPALYIAGKGYMVDVDQVEFHTGSSLKSEPVVIDNPAIDTKEKAYKACAERANKYRGSEITLQLSASSFRGGVEGNNTPDYHNLAGCVMYGWGLGWIITSATRSQEGLTVSATPYTNVSVLHIQRKTPFNISTMSRGKTLGELSVIGVLDAK